MPPVWPRQDARRFTSEIKFVVDATVGAEIRDWARTRLAADPHGGGACGDEYPVTSLYLDTDVFDVFHRRGSYGRSKYRVRRYDDAPTAFLERKLRTRGCLSKRRTIVDIGALPRLTADTPHAGVEMAWFRRRVALRRLRPVCQISYTRMARIANTLEGPSRLTLDEELSAVQIDSFSFEPAPGTRLLADRMIVELKHGGSMPAVFRQLVEAFTLTPQRSSKYRAAVEALGLVGTHV
jgi:hypothetical protein